MLSKVAGNIALVVSALLYLIPMPLLTVNVTTRGEALQGQVWGLILILLPLWFCLTGALCSSVSAGGLDWLAVGRGAQVTIVILTCIAMAVITGFSGILRQEKADQIPWAVRPLTPGGWAMWLFPPVVMLFCLVTINPSLRSSVPEMALRAPIGVVGGVSLLVGAGLLLEVFVSSVQRQNARVEAEVSADQQRTLNQIEEVRGLDGEKDLYQLLGYTNRYNDAPLREAALQKIKANPKLEDQLATGLRGRWCGAVFIFLDDADAPDNKALAEPVRDGITFLADRARERVKDPNDLMYDDSFDFDARLILSVADKFRAFGVDYAPAIRSYRSALDEPRRQKVKFNCVATLDNWLTQAAKRAK